MKIKIILASLLFVSMSANAFNLQQCAKTFSVDQMIVLKDAYFAGADREYGLTLAAIAWQESSAGEVLYNLEGPAFGAFQNLSSTVQKRLAQNGEKLSRNKIAVMLMTDFGFAAEMAMAELDYWKGRHDGNWQKMVASYYAGGNWKYSAGQEYLKKIQHKVNFLKQNGCMLNEF